jgi:hypothetical protein
VLIAIKLLHTLIWTALAGLVLALPVLGLRRRFRAAAIVSGIILAECLVLLLNGGRCPLTDWAARFTADRSANFDIYLPVWLSQYNKQIFGLLFVVGEAVVVWCWIFGPRTASLPTLLPKEAVERRTRSLASRTGTNRRSLRSGGEAPPPVGMTVRLKALTDS